MSAAVAVTVCPPSSQNIHFDLYQHLRVSNPVAARYGGQGWTSNGISFDDYARIQTQTMTAAPMRRFATPAWAVNDMMLRKVLTEYLVQRAHAHKSLPKGADDIDKIRWAERLLAAKLPSLEQQVTALCDEYVELRRNGADPVRLKKLESLIGNIDSSIIFNRAPARTALATVYFYYRVGMSSTHVGQQVGLNPPAVRQLLKRIWAAAERCGYEERVRIFRCSSKQAALEAGHTLGT
jgi:hypothetical protein